MVKTKADYQAIPALPAHYAGVTFRSRLEARWAHYFDLIGVQWQYEPEGFALAAGNYCPDFRCFEFYVEVKPTEYDRLAHAEKLAELSQVTGVPVFCVVDEPSLKPQTYWQEGKEAGKGIFGHYAFQAKGWTFPDMTPASEDFIGREMADRARKIRFNRGGIAEVDWEVIQARNAVIRHRHAAYKVCRGLDEEAGKAYYVSEIQPIENRLKSLNKLAGL